MRSSLLCALIFVACVYPADQAVGSYDIATTYREAWSARYGWPAYCTRRWEHITISFVDVANAENECSKYPWDSSDRMACHHMSPVDADSLITVPYNYQPEQNIVHELTHILLLCSSGDSDSDHTSEAWSWQAAWVDAYLQNYSVIDAIKEAQ